MRVLRYAAYAVLVVVAVVWAAASLLGAAEDVGGLFGQLVSGGLSVVTALVLIALGVLVLAPEIKRNLPGFFGADPPIRLRVWLVDDEERDDGRIAGARTRLFHVAVEGDRRVAAKCRGQIIRLSEKRNGKWTPSTRLDPDISARPQLCKWQEGFGGERDLEPDFEQHLDLCFSVEGDGVFYLAPTEWAPGVPQDYSISLDPGTYQVQLRVSAVDAPHVDRFFEVTFDGEWRSLQVKRKRKLSHRAW